MNNPLAFPGERRYVVGSEGHGYCEEKRAESGMTLRDYFAARALQGLIQLGYAAAPGLGRRAYEYADEMLKSRDAASNARQPEGK